MISNEVEQFSQSFTHMDSMKNSKLFVEKALINGQWLTAQDGATFDVYNPASGEIIGTVPNLGKSETELAIEAANEAFRSWKTTTAKTRHQLLMQWYELILNHLDELARLMVLEQGKPLAEAKGEVIYAANFIQWFAEQAKRIHGTIMDGFSPTAQLQYTKEPVGVVGIITPWNFPLAMITRKVAPALAAGCTVVIKPSEFTPYSALALMQLSIEAGIPAGVCNVVTTDRAAEVGQAMTASKMIRKMSFTGSTRVGKILLSQAATTVKRMSMELGGNAPFIVFDDADFASAIPALMTSKFRNTGQTCVCANRILVQDRIYDQFVEQFTNATKKLVVGDGLSDGVTQGPLINEAALEKVESHVQHALELDGVLQLGGKGHEKGLTFFEPTVISEVPQESRFNSEETFGPVAPMIRFKEEEEAIQIANQTDYGLSAYFCSTNMSRIHRVLKELETGMVGVNTGMLANEFGPFGGVKESGLGREGSVLGIEEYLENKYSIIAYS